MTIERVNSASWGIGDELTSAQMNAVDINTTYALDKRHAQFDALGSIVTLTGPGRIIGKYATGADANATYLVSEPNSIIVASVLNGDRIYTLSNTNALPGDRIDILNQSLAFSVEVRNAASDTLTVLSAAVTNGAQSAWAGFLFNGAAWILERSAQGPLFPTPLTFFVTDTWLNPGFHRVRLYGCGGGGGGGGGWSGANTAIQAAQAGAGGGGALERIAEVDVTPGVLYEGAIGAGGTGGAGKPFGSGSAEDGGDGGDTIFRLHGGYELARFPGAKGGRAGSGIEPIDTPQRHLIVAGGAPVLIPNRSIVTPTSLRNLTLCHGPSFGGDGRHKDNVGPLNASGASSVHGYAGGTTGASGADDSGAMGGHGGGGGGAGPYGHGGDGGAGGNGASAGGGGFASAGPVLGPNLGAGGGGGGAGGGGVGTGGAGGNGRPGSSGRLVLIPIR